MQLKAQGNDSGWLRQLDLTYSQLQLVATLFGEMPPQFHSWMLGAATRMRNAGISIDQALKVLRERADKHSRVVEVREIRSAVEKAFNGQRADFVAAPQASGFSRLPARHKLQSLMGSLDWPKGYGVEELRNDASDESASLCRLRPEQLLSLLFYDVPVVEEGAERFVCVGNGSYRSECVRIGAGIALELPDWANLAVPNLAHSRTGRTQEGSLSKRSLSMFPHRDYIVLESDLGEGTEDTQAALIQFTQKVLKQRPVMVLHSGGKSLHSWWSMRSLEEMKVERLLRELAGLFDTAALSRHQFFRLPNGWRDVGAEEPVVKQKVILFDHEALAIR
jgi:hypothetical protein